jgi:hypothetical protein
MLRGWGSAAVAALWAVAAGGQTQEYEVTDLGALDGRRHGACAGCLVRDGPVQSAPTAARDSRRSTVAPRSGRPMGASQ